MTTTPPVTFDFPTWTSPTIPGQVFFPEFAPLGATLGQAYFNLATATIVANATTNPAFGDGQLQNLIYLATSHVAWLNCPKDGNGNPAATGQKQMQLVGKISNASEGSVSVTLEYPLDGSSSAEEKYLAQTQYGVQLWQALAPYRTARYAARPTIVIGGRFRGIFGGGFGPGRTGGI